MEGVIDLTQVAVQTPLGSLRRDHPGRLWNLRELMNTFRAKILCTRVRNLTWLKDAFNHHAGKIPSGTFLTAQASFAQELQQSLLLCHELGFIDAHKTLTRVQKVLHGGNVDASRLTGEAMRAHDALLDDMDKHKYVHIDAALAQYVDAQRPFGDEVWEEFKEARTDITEAGNCIAVGLGTAAVFHLMRVAEHGLRAVGRKFRVSVKFKGRPQAIEYTDWQDVITAIRNQITAARSVTNKKERQRRLDFYSDVADQSEYIKDIWRNTVSHARKGYNLNEAIGVHQRVEGYMTRLAKELGAMKTTPTSGASKPSRVRQFPTSAPK